MIVLILIYKLTDVVSCFESDFLKLTFNSFNITSAYDQIKYLLSTLLFIAEDIALWLCLVWIWLIIFLLVFVLLQMFKTFSYFFSSGFCSLVLMIFRISLYIRVRIVCLIWVNVVFQQIFSFLLFIQNWKSIIIYFWINYNTAFIWMILFLASLLLLFILRSFFVSFQYLFILFSWRRHYWCWDSNLAWNLLLIILHEGLQSFINSIYLYK